jgi:hypothetical protein
MISRAVKGVIVGASDVMSDVLSETLTLQYHCDSPDRPLCAISSAQNGLIYELMLCLGARARKTGGDIGS